MDFSKASGIAGKWWRFGLLKGSCRYRPVIIEKIRTGAKILGQVRPQFAARPEPSGRPKNAKGQADGSFIQA
jgi:hypothetical protein